MIDILRQLSVVLGSLAFLGVCWWAFSPRRKKRFDEDAKLPFADEEDSSQTTSRENGEKSGNESGTQKKEQGQDKQ